jgi:hypothetical protein
MSSGLRALMDTAKQEALPFTISMYVGQMLITGYVGPAKAWSDATKASLEQETKKQLNAVGRSGGGPDQVEGLRDWFKRSSRVLDCVGQVESPPDDEVTLYDVVAVPSVGTQGTQSGGVRLPVVRVPLSSINMWWAAEGTSFAGKGATATQQGSSWGVGLGFLLPLPF